jgi:tetratricopeptide (TPR) repeat protein
MSTDFLDFDVENMYFDTPLPEKAEQLINEAADLYGTETAELYLLRAYVLAPEHLSTMVALYRYYYYQHRLDDALAVVENAIRISARELHLSPNWEEVLPLAVAAGAHKSVGLVRFYLLALKAAGFVMVRMGDVDRGADALRKVIEHDPNDRLKTKDLLEIILSYTYANENKNVLRFAEA